jgi:lipopolysaccharide export system protein LptC
MSGAAPPVQRDGRLLGVRRYRVPSPAGLARRRRAIGLTKLIMPALALTLLTSLALWPELERETGRAREAAKTLAQVHGDTVMEARYSSVDQHGRPFTVTASVARQVNGDLIDLTNPKGDITLQSGTWVMLQAPAGVYRQRENMLDLTHGVTLYRDDGTTVLTDSASIDLKGGAAAGTEAVHATGPFGKLDAQGGFTAADNGQQIFFSGPAKLLLNGANGP